MVCALVSPSIVGLVPLAGSPAVAAGNCPDTYSVSPTQMALAMKLLSEPKRFTVVCAIDAVAIRVSIIVTNANWIFFIGFPFFRKWKFRLSGAHVTRNFFDGAVRRENRAFLPPGQI